MSNEQANTRTNRFSLIPHPVSLILLIFFAAVLRFYHLSTLPPGLWFDEAWVSIAAHGNATPIYFSASFGGMHPAVVYLTRFAQTITNNHPLTIRYLLATIGTLTIPLAYLTTKELLQVTSYKLQVTSSPPTTHYPPSTPSYFPLAAAFILTILYPFLHFSRLGFESMLPAPAALLTFYLLAKHFTTYQPLPTNRPFIFHPLSLIPSIFLGFILGLCLYTFDTGRFIPLAVALAYWWMAWVNRYKRPLSKTIMPFLVMVITAVIVAAPLLNFFWQNWTQFTERAAVTTYNTLGLGADSVPLAIGRNILRTFGGLSLPGWGDSISRHNLPGRPVFDVVLSIFFWVGLLTLIRHPKRPLSIILLSWLILGFLPVILTDGAPTYTRFFVAMPALAITAAVGLTTAYNWLFSHFRAKHASSLLFTFYFILLLLSATATLYDYFIRWPQTPDLYDDFQVGQWEAGHLALEQSQTAITYFAPDLINEANPTLDLLLHDSTVRSHPAAPCLIYHSNPAQPLTYIIDTRADKELVSQLQALYPDAQTAVAIRHQPTNETIYRTLHIAPQSPIQNPKSKIPATAVFADTIQLVSYELDSDFTIHHSPFTILPSSSLTLTLHWLTLAPPTADYTLFIHLYPTDSDNEVPITQLDAQPCWPTHRWHIGETIRDQHTIQLPADLPAGDYTLALGFYTYPDFQRLTLSPSANSLPNNRYSLLQFTVE